MKIGIIGLGTVGSVMSRLLGRRAAIVGYDVAVHRAYPRDALATCDCAVVCVPAPSDADTGACDTSAVYEAVRQLPVQRILLKSTVPPGTTEDLVAATGKQVCFSPVYVGEHSWNEPSSVTDSVEVPFAVLGGEPAIRHYFVDVLLTSLGPTTKFLQCTAREAELTKYMENLFHATKAAFVNEFRQVAEAFGADWYTVREGWLLDPRVGPAFTAVPDQERGFGGTCLPKDLDALIAACATVGYRPELLEEVRRSNVRFRDPRTG